MWRRERVGRGIALLFHDRGTRRGWVVSNTPRPHLTSGKDPVPILQEAGWASGQVWMAGKSRPHRDSISDRPAIRPTFRQIHEIYAKWAMASLKCAYGQGCFLLSCAVYNCIGEKRDAFPLLQKDITLGYLHACSRRTFWHAPLARWT